VMPMPEASVHALWPSGQAAVDAFAQMLCDGLPLLVRIAAGEGALRAVEDEVERLRVVAAWKPPASSREQPAAFVALVERRASLSRSIFPYLNSIALSAEPRDDIRAAMGKSQMDIKNGGGLDDAVGVFVAGEVSRVSLCGAQEGQFAADCRPTPAHDFALSPPIVSDAMAGSGITTIVVPLATLLAKWMTSWLRRRMHPDDTALPMDGGSLLP